MEDRISLNLISIVATKEEVETTEFFKKWFGIDFRVSEEYGSTVKSLEIQAKF